jgi:hypothetical protein
MLIVAVLIRYIQDDIDTAKSSQCQAEYVDETVGFVF